MIVRNISRNRFRAGLSVFGVAVSAGIIVMGFFSLDALNYMLRFQFGDFQREDVKVSFPLERGKAAYLEASRFPHVRDAEPLLQYPFEISSEWRSKDTIVVGIEPGATMMNLIDSNHRSVDVGDSGLVLSDRLARDLQVKPGDTVRLKPLQGRVTGETDVTVTKIMKQYLGTSGYMNLSALSRVVGESFAVNTVLLRTVEGRENDLNKALKDVPGVSSIEIKQMSYQNLKNTLRQNMSVMNSMLVIFAGVIAFSVIYNVTTVALTERQRELASLRVLGFSSAEVGRIVYLENFLLAGLGLVLGIPFGMAICRLLVRAYDTELYRLPYHIEDRTFFITAGMITLFVLISNYAVRHKILSLDMVEVLKARE
jgi:putative ABC transport system permease protein